MPPATSYDFEVRTKSSAKSLSSELSATVSTDCKEFVVCNRSARQTVTMIKFGDGNHFVNRDIQPGTYTIGTPSDTSSCEWERLSDLEGSPNQVAESGGYTASGQVTIGGDDAAFYTSGCGVWSLSE